MTDTPIFEDALPEEDPLLFSVSDEMSFERLDKVLAQLIPQHSRSRIQTWIEGGHVMVNGQVAKVRQNLREDDQITVFVQPAPEDQAFKPENVDFEVLAQSPDWIVVNKPVGLVTHPGAGNWSGTLLNGLLFRFPELAQVARAGIVHRLDKDTSGLLVVARNEVAQTHLVRQLQARTMGREYLALAHGRMLSEGRVDLPIGRDMRVPVRMSVEKPAAPKAAVTHYKLMRVGEYYDSNVSQVICKLETGRTHQIRVHLASLGHPLLGDTLYGGRMLGQVTRQMLHAHQLRFEDPGGAGEVSFVAPMPEDMAQVVEAIRWG
ncbi:RluA family pseudouridine synthase [Orrella sp. NBD-18]|uniref:Pseudouridine synthase n=1 Tax=Sheuella amnicola TaxID=2707330 RepID=A0A6B2QW48_9BURK|nr:RluA family pseudouridine synthase [Sheuella amnicola]NDY82630.1 RluA family pseudouridine synthase [Sheuella amnicola]